MKPLVLSRADVEAVLPMDKCIAAVEEALIALARGQIYQPPRTIVSPPEANGVMGFMAAYRSDAAAGYAYKATCVIPSNSGTGRDVHAGVVVLQDSEHGDVVAIIDAGSITAIRTAATSAAATKALARRDASVLAVLGTGTQARPHLLAMAELGGIREARIVGRTRGRAETLAAELAGRVPFALRAVADVDEGLRGADVVVTVTSATEPIVGRSALQPGMHLNVVGGRRTREVESEALAFASLFVDHREAALSEARDVLDAIGLRLIGSSHIRAELGEVLAGAAPGRTSADEVTYFRSLGIATEDLAAAQAAFIEAARRGIGTRVAL